MSQLVRIAPGVVFSSDVLGAEWVRKFGPSAGGDALPQNSQPPERRGRPKNDLAHANQESHSIQMSLL
ncbi:hypothetical protein DF141_28120 [Burkholderia cenocepacia]|uniref:hypothetical protein n=1 Tax=Burkholderia ambifaria TaxID=152480 RepID=UPI000F59DD12|nr:hypothetical protein [Burkholderia ambifaria]RQU68073.1 hypothetical protein DF141_28120 [Burkholderia cenocepacia]RQV11910.1 hypothetical protein DF039_24380 [Burkholderia cenocepacia]